MPTTTELTCLFCADIFKAAVKFPCGHPICYSCAQVMIAVEALKDARRVADARRAHHASHQLVSGDSPPLVAGDIEVDLACPTCSEVMSTRASLGAGAIEPDYDTRQAVNSYHQEQTRAPPCWYECGQDATISCTECAHACCESCFAEAHKLGPLRRHERGELDAARRHEEQEEHLCTKHHTESELYCLDCNRVISCLCFITPHKAHDYVPVVEIVKTFRQELLEHADDMDGRSALVNTRAEEAQTMLQDVVETHEAFEAQVVDVFQRLREELDRRQAQLLEMSAEIRKEKVAALQTQVEALGATAQHLAEQSHRARAAAAESGDNAAVIRAVPAAKTALALTTLEELELAPWVEADVTTHLEGVDRVEALVAKVGFIGAMDPPRRPAQPNVYITSPHSIMVKWHSLDRTAEWFQVLMNRDGGEYSVAYEGEGLSFEAAGLVSTSTYGFKLVALNQAGASRPTAEIFLMPNRQDAAYLACNRIQLQLEDIVRTHDEILEKTKSTTRRFDPSDHNASLRRVEAALDPTSYRNSPPPPLDFTSDKGLLGYS